MHNLCKLLRKLASMYIQYYIDAHKIWHNKENKLMYFIVMLPQHSVYFVSVYTLFKITLQVHTEEHRKLTEKKKNDICGGV